MDTAEDLEEDLEEDQLLHLAAQMSIEESCQMERETGPGRSEALKLTEAIKEGDALALQKLCDFPAAFTQADERGWFPLHKAVVQPVVRVLQAVLHASFRLTLEERTSEGESFLTLAVTAGFVENVKMLLDHGASPHTTNSNNESPLLLAVRSGSRRMVSCLIAGGARVEQVCLKKWTAMHEACRAGCVGVAELLLQNGGQVLEADQYGVTLLGIAAEYSHCEVLELLIKHGADVNGRAPNGDSVLYDAAGSGNLDCIDILLQHGANPNVPNLSSQLPIHHAAYEGHLPALRTLIPITTRRALRLSGHSPVHSAAAGGHAPCLELLLREGFDVNARLAPRASDGYGDARRSPLYFAVSNRDAACTEILLRSGAQPDLDPLCCLLVAVRSGCREVAALLLEAGADANCGWSDAALQYCLKDEAMMRLLLDAGYDAGECFRCNHGDDRDAPSRSSPETKGRVAVCDLLCVPRLEGRAGRVVSILLDYVGAVSLCSKLSKLVETQEEWPRIHRTTRNPRSLSHLSRVEVRKHLGLSAVMSAQLPDRLRDFLLFRGSAPRGED
ncbi:ankyrin repeat and SOCS box protein 15-like [Pungitius pungitius]|uniref:ankyrin repeat and SOCS box protein 15-like n=1 Tax=Pungitius pungitius TaxID=134920 RepID=UPI002E106FA9